MISLMLYCLFCCVNFENLHVHNILIMDKKAVLKDIYTNIKVPCCRQ